MRPARADWLPAMAVLRAGALLRNPLLELRVWILGSFFGNYFGPFWPISWSDSASGRQNTPIGGLKSQIRPNLTKIDDLGAPPKKIYYYVLDATKKIF